MAQQMGKSRVTEIQVRMDCNGCVQKIKKALHGIHGIYDLYIDFPQQKITIVGSADPEKIVKALKKTRKSAIVCSHIEQAEPPTEPEEPAPAENEAPPPESSNPPTEAPPAEEPPKEPPKDPPTQENQQAEEKQTHDEGADNTKRQPDQPSKPRDVEEVHVIYHYPPDYGYRHNFSQGMSSHEPPRDHGYRYNYGQTMIHEPPRDPRYNRYNYGPSMSQEPPRDHGYNRYNYGQSMSYEPLNYGRSMIHEPPPGNTGYRNNHVRPTGPEFRPEAPPPGQPPVYVTHSYNSYQPSPYVTGYEYIRSPPRYTQYTRPEHYSEDYHYGNDGNGTIGSVFSDENPNACTIA
ncbi:heavy metal-associated isoprenylated plant protein 35-like isoform X1 [Nicotiana sylvestris]|uniref:Early nodulin-75-like isoform X1 n=1 Tax=Nicotiana sylvestris TaxID=4096 RepID=A0A1U7WN16_NICSY|nr:PREDICTED: early nodulin-75-like isoform X1 [Nicotiana sylvestris]